MSGLDSMHFTTSGIGSEFDLATLFTNNDWTQSSDQARSVLSLGDVFPCPQSTKLAPFSSSRPSPLASSTNSLEAPSEAVSPTVTLSHDRHSGDQRHRFRCLKSECNRRFTSQYTLKVHMDAHKAKPRVVLPCTLGCSEHFSRRHDRLRHEVIQHGKVCEFTCDDCGRFFSSQKTLGNHKCPVARGKVLRVMSCAYLHSVMLSRHLLTLNRI
jgi:hypothetical protein